LAACGSIAAKDWAHKIPWLLTQYHGFTTHSQLSEAKLLEQGIKPNSIRRLFVGTEHIDDLKAGFEAVK
jgi:O-acetylhomoserine/O-acetylserine sulfhydrylase-like pyridoxal-dependent enzyme